MIQVHFYDGYDWIVVDETVDETTPRFIGVDGVLGLDTVFNCNVNSNDFEGYGSGTYRVYAEFRDPWGNVLVCDDDSEMIGTYEFTITF